MTSRPDLTRQLAPDVFLDHYWLRAELAAFCRQNGVSAAGSKEDLGKRVRAILAGDPLPQPVKARARNAAMPAHFTRETRIAPGWRCSQALRSFLGQEIGRPFRFDARMRALIHSGAGKTLAEVLDDWTDHQTQAGQTDIPAQFEYNRFVRAYRQVAPDACHRDVAAAWMAFRTAPKSRRGPVADYAAPTGTGA